MEKFVERYYFKETMKLEKDDLFISRIDLNIENGQIEEPFIPIIRFSSPIFCENGNKKGMRIYWSNQKKIIRMNREYWQLKPKNLK